MRRQPLRMIRYSIWIPDFQSRNTVTCSSLTLIRSQIVLSIEDVSQPEQPEEDKGKVKKIKQSELIDKFILANPRIEPVRDPVKDACRRYFKAICAKGRVDSLQRPWHRIYINQGYYSKAIDIYEQLSLKFPEKSSYFASQIELVKVYLKK